MIDKIRNDFASYGLEILKHSVLLVLHEAKDKGELLQPNEIRHRLGIPHAKTERRGHANLILATLRYLKDEEKVDDHWLGGATAWQITEKRRIIHRGLSLTSGYLLKFQKENSISSFGQGLIYHIFQP